MSGIERKITQPGLSGPLPLTGPVDSSRSGLHHLLKSRTAALHARVEKSFDLKHRVATLVGYKDTLLTLHGIHSAVQSSLGRLEYEGVVTDREQTLRRIGWLNQDLAAFGLLASFPTIPHLDLKTAAEALGCLYVIEGSALGGQHIARFVFRTLGCDETSGARYFGGLGKQTGSAWATFVERLEAHPMTIAAGVEHGARQTFMLFAATLTAAASVERGRSV